MGQHLEGHAHLVSLREEGLITKGGGGSFT
jgi:hypothetical protein